MKPKFAPSIPLPGLESIALPICPGCKNPTQMMGQWSPSPRSSYLCRECSLRYPSPDVFVPEVNSIGVGLRQEMQYAAEREQYHARSQVLEELQKGCMHSLDDVSAHDYLPCMQDDDLFTMESYGVSGRGWHRPIEVIFERTRQCRRCRNRLLYVVSQRQQTASWIAQHRDGTNTAHTLSLPVCHECGRVHDRVTLRGDAAAYCQECDDKHAVQSFWDHRGIFGADDDETILDRIQKSHPGLFEHGVLPQMWFELRLASIELGE